MRWLVERDLRKELGVPPTWARDAEKIEFHKRQLALLDLAKQAPRCEHVFTDGRCCKAPRVKKGKLCYAHTLMEEKRPVELNLPPLEDANAVMLWLMDVLRGLAEGRITEKTAGIMLYGLQLAMVNARFTTFQDTKHAEMVRIAPKTRAKPQRTRRSTKEETTRDFTAKDAEVAKEGELGDRGDRRNRALSPESEARATPIFTAKGAEVAKNEDQEELATVTPTSEGRALPQGTQKSTEEEASDDFPPENAEIAEEEKSQDGTALRVADRLEPQNAEGNPGVESAKSIFFGVEPGEGVADNRPVSPPPEPPRKSSQSEVLMIPKDVEHHLRR
ncbi:MAG TPA: hypothetical protein VKV30_02015 [Candidatus Angelobacter sp.]|nr:hypothetical protein [Candidatus Angelobacter sp.]